MDATISAIEGITGLKINYWALVNLAGFRGLVDAVGGVTLNVRQPIPVGGLGADVTGYIKPGVRKLNGFDTLWFARSRDSSDDYSRMARQKCVMNAMLHQISPQTVLTNFEKIAKASSQMVSTDIPASEVDTLHGAGAEGEEPAGRDAVAGAAARSTPADPDIGLIKRKVAQAHRGVGAPAGRIRAPPPEAAVDGHRGLDRLAEDRVRRQRRRATSAPSAELARMDLVFTGPVCRVARARAVPLRRRARGRGRPDP